MQRLKTRSQFQAVLAGQRIASTAHFVLHQRDLKDIGGRTAAQGSQATGTESAPRAPPDESVMGAMVPKRWAKRAVTRNMIKRQIFSVGLQAEPGLPRAAFVVRLRTGFDRKQFVSASSVALKRQVHEELVSLFDCARPHRSAIVSASPPLP